MNNPMIQMLMNQLQSRNPQGYNMINQAMNSGGNPQAILQQMMGNASPQQVQNVLAQAKQYGVPDTILSQIQNMGK